MIIYFKIYIWN